MLFACADRGLRQALGRPQGVLPAPQAVRGACACAGHQCRRQGAAALPAVQRLPPAVPLLRHQAVSRGLLHAKGACSFHQEAKLRAGLPACSVLEGRGRPLSWPAFRPLPPCAPSLPQRPAPGRSCFPPLQDVRRAVDAHQAAEGGAQAGAESRSCV